MSEVKTENLNKRIEKCNACISIPANRVHLPLTITPESEGEYHA